MSCREQGKKRNEKEEEETKNGKKRRRVTIFQSAVLVALLLPVLLFISYQTFSMLIIYCVCLQCYQGKHDSPPSESLEIRENLKQNICPNIS